MVPRRVLPEVLHMKGFLPAAKVLNATTEYLLLGKYFYVGNCYQRVAIRIQKQLWSHRCSPIVSCAAPNSLQIVELMLDGRKIQESATELQQEWIQRVFLNIVNLASEECDQSSAECTSTGFSSV